MDNEIQEFNTARQAVVQTYKSTVLKVRKIATHITFNKTCLNKSITPKYAQIKIKHNNQACLLYTSIYDCYSWQLNEYWKEIGLCIVRFVTKNLTMFLFRIFRIKCKSILTVSYKTKFSSHNNIIIHVQYITVLSIYTETNKLKYQI